MNESFADLSVVGDFETNTQVTPFMDSLSENTLKGYALSSVYGAKTPNSEWEFETGNSMAFLPDGSVVYQQYINDDPTSIVSNLKNIGYTTVAMHPYYATGWSRNKIYPHLGYDETYFIDDFDQTKILREYITDQELYDKIIDRYEKRAMTRSFTSWVSRCKTMVATVRDMTTSTRRFTRLERHTPMRTSICHF